MSGEVLTNDIRDRLWPTLIISAVLASLATFALSIAAGLGDSWTR
ncbi:hypothetical protein [Ornithinimicrobium sp. INDO-MA30-4]|nr:hypothetical protein [Ornithinimicrobium sp. INDO-MA30-4]